MKKAEKGGTRPAHKASAKILTSMMTLSIEAWDAGQAVVRPHSLKMVARAERTLRRASGLSMINLSTVGATTGGKRDGKRGELELDWRQRLEPEEEGRVGSVRAAKGGTTVCNRGSV